MRLVKLSCPVCGEVLTKESETSYHCPCCENKFEEQSVCDEQKIREAFDEQKEEAYNKAKQNLFKEVHEEYQSDEKIQYWCNEVRKYSPNDFFAQFYQLFTKDESTDDECNFLCEYLQRGNFDFSEEVIKYVLKVAQSDRLLVPLVGILEASGLQSGNYRDQINDLAEKLSEGIFFSEAPRDVFVAYSSKDISKVTEIVNYIEQNGFTCFYASRNLRHGKGAKENYAVELQKAMHNCKCIVFISSENSRRLDCDAMKVEISYLRQTEPDKAHVEFVIDPDKYSKTPLIVKNVLKDYFNGMEWCLDRDDLVDRIFNSVSGFDEQPEEETTEFKGLGLPETKRDNRCLDIAKQLSNKVFGYAILGDSFVYDEEQNCYSLVFITNNVKPRDRLRDINLNLLNDCLMKSDPICEDETYSQHFIFGDKDIVVSVIISPDEEDPNASYIHICIYKQIKDIALELVKVQNLSQDDFENIKPRGLPKEFHQNDIVEFGLYKQEYSIVPTPIKWRVLNVDNNRALLLAEDILEARPFSSSNSNNWEKSDIRKWLNGEFLDTAFTDEERRRILMSRVENGNSSAWPACRARYESKNYNCCPSTNDFVFLLSIEEMTMELYGFNDDAEAYGDKRVKHMTEHVKENGLFVLQKEQYMLRSPDSDSMDKVWAVLPSGCAIGKVSVKEPCGIVPAIYVSLK